MRIAILISIFLLICAVLAAMGYPAIQVGGDAVTGPVGFVVGLTAAVVPPLFVFVVSKARRLFS